MELLEGLKGFFQNGGSYAFMAVMAFVIYILWRKTNTMSAENKALTEKVFAEKDSHRDTTLTIAPMVTELTRVLDRLEKKG